jgi:hypothetical protein
VEVYRVTEGRGPVFGREAGSVKERAGSDAEFVVINFDSTVLGRAIGPGWLQRVLMYFQQHGLKSLASS